MLDVAGYLLARQGEALRVIGLIVSAAGRLMFVLGCVQYAMRKRYSGSVGLLLGMWSILGLAIMFAMPDVIDSPHD